MCMSLFTFFGTTKIIRWTMTHQKRNGKSTEVVKINSDHLPQFASSKLLQCSWQYGHLGWTRGWLGVKRCQLWLQDTSCSTKQHRQAAVGHCVWSVVGWLIVYQDGDYLQPIGQYSQTICRLQIMMITPSRCLVCAMYISNLFLKLKMSTWTKL